jgi:transcription initiation factor IIE alpha subunit
MHEEFECGECGELVESFDAILAKHGLLELI